MTQLGTGVRYRSVTSRRHCRTAVQPPLRARKQPWRGHECSLGPSVSRWRGCHLPIRLCRTGRILAHPPIQLAACSPRSFAADFSADDYDRSLRVNAEATGLLLEHCRAAKAALVMSTVSVYKPHPDPWHAFREDDPLGDAMVPNQAP